MTTGAIAWNRGLLGVYPENLRYILLENKEFTFFDNSEGVVRPPQERYVLRSSAVFQYHSVVNNHAKAALIKKRRACPRTLRIHEMGRRYLSDYLNSQDAFSDCQQVCLS